MDIDISPCVLKGRVDIPASKSFAHRAIILACLSKGRGVIKNVTISDDIEATLKAVGALGCKYSFSGRNIEITAPDNTDISGMTELKTIDCCESGSTLRFMIPLCLAVGGNYRFIGRGNLHKRPLDVLDSILKNNNIIVNDNSDGNLDITYSGKLSSGEYRINGDVSSQFITGILFAMTVIDGPSVLFIRPPVVSKGYIDITLSVMRDFGMEVINKDYREICIRRPSIINDFNYTVEGDYSQAAFFLVANYLGSEVEINGLNPKSVQGDKVIKQYLKELEKAETYREFDARDCPDIIPVFTVAAALTPGKTVIKNAGRLRIKECDRLSAITQELNKIGADITENADSLTIIGKDRLNGGQVWSHNDHRIAMSLAVAAIKCQNALKIRDCECVSKSYPEFFKDFNRLSF